MAGVRVRRMRRVRWWSCRGTVGTGIGASVMMGSLVMGILTVWVAIVVS